MTVPFAMSTSNSGCCATACRAPAAAKTSHAAMPRRMLRIIGRARKEVTLTLRDGGSGVKPCLQPRVQRHRYRSGFARSDPFPVHVHDWRDVCRGAGDEELIEREQLLRRECLLAYRHALLARNFEDQLTRHARQDQRPERMGAQRAVLDAEHARMRAFGHDAVANQDCFEGAGGLRFLL